MPDEAANLLIEAEEAAKALLERIQRIRRLTAAAPSTAPVSRGLSEPAAFFNHMRDSKVLGPKLSPDEVNGCGAILEACEGWPIADTAYALATAWHETAGTMQPIHEYGGPSYFRKMYDIEGARPAKARELGNTVPGDGVQFAGRGYVQLTGRANYAKASAALGVDLIGNPDRAMEPEIAARIMVQGMRAGWFTARDLDDDLPRSGPATRDQFIRSRDIINGRDKAEAIADAAMVFQEALAKGGWA